MFSVIIDLFVFQEYGPLRIMQNIIFTKSSTSKSTNICKPRRNKHEWNWHGIYNLYNDVLWIDKTKTMVSVIDLFLFQEYGPLRIMQNIIFTKSSTQKSTNSSKQRKNKHNEWNWHGIYSLYNNVLWIHKTNKQWSQLLHRLIPLSRIWASENNAKHDIYRNIYSKNQQRTNKYGEWNWHGIYKSYNNGLWIHETKKQWCQFITYDVCLDNLFCSRMQALFLFRSAEFTSWFSFSYLTFRRIMNMYRKCGKTIIKITLSLTNF